MFILGGYTFPPATLWYRGRAITDQVSTKAGLFVEGYIFLMYSPTIFDICQLLCITANIMGEYVRKLRPSQNNPASIKHILVIIQFTHRLYFILL